MQTDCCERTDVGQMKVCRVSSCALWVWNEPYFDQCQCPLPMLNPAPLCLSLHRVL